MLYYYQKILIEFGLLNFFLHPEKQGHVPSVKGFATLFKDASHDVQEVLLPAVQPRHVWWHASHNPTPYS